MLALYLLTLGVSSGLVGAFAHQVLSSQGYVPSFQAGVFLAGGVGCGYAALQLFYLALVRILKPTRSGTPLLCESVSHAAAVAFVPYLLHVAVPWPDPVLFKVEPLIYLGAFCVLHVFFKLVSFFAALQGEPSGRSAALGYAVAAGFCALASYLTTPQWIDALQAAHAEAPAETATYRAGAEQAAARLMPEGAVLESPLAAMPGRCLTLRWANAPDAEEELTRIYVTVSLEGSESKRIAKSVVLKKYGWSGLRIAADQVPADVQRCSVSWQATKEPGWRRLTGLRPVIASNRHVLLSGPFQHVARENAEQPNVVILLIDGLGSNRMTSMGYKKETTPSLDRLVYRSLAFPNAYTPAPDTSAAAMTLLTGLNPLRHGYLGRVRGPLPNGCATLPELLSQNGYATAAFTEGDAYGDLAPGNGFERGFEVFDASLAAKNPEETTAAATEDAGEGVEQDAAAKAEAEAEVEVGAEAEQEPLDTPPSKPDTLTRSKATLDKAQAWIDEHADVKFAVFVRLGELRESLANAGGNDGQPVPSDPASYDAALTRLDRCIGALVKHLHDYDTRKNTCIVVTSPFGYDFVEGRASLRLTEPTLRVPLVLYVPGGTKNQRQDMVSLEDVPATLAKLAQVKFPAVVDGADFLEKPISAAPVSMGGDPLALTIRDATWRLIWDARIDPSAIKYPDNPGVERLYNLSRVEKEGYRDLSVRYADVAQQWRARLEKYVRDNVAARAAERKP